MMSSLRTGVVPAVSFARFAICAVLGSAIIAGGCASSSTQYGATGYGYGAAVAGYTQSSEGEIEDDGLPVQAAPHVRIHQTPDDPSEPWSPNYGGSAVHDQATSYDNTQPADVAAAASSETYSSGQEDAYSPEKLAWQPIPDDLPAGFRKRLLDSEQY